MHIYNIQSYQKEGNVWNYMVIDDIYIISTTWRSLRHIEFLVVHIMFSIYYQWPPSSEIPPVPLKLLVRVVLALDSPANHEYNVNQHSAHWSTRECTRRHRIHINKSPVAAASSSPFYKLAHFEWTIYFLSEPCPTPARQRKWTKELLVTWY